jgi:PAS domain S-box-containing protein
MNSPLASLVNSADLGLFHRMLDALPAAAYTCGEDGVIEYFNRHAAELWGREPKLRDRADQFCGSLKLFSADGEPIPHEQCGMAKALRENTEFNGEKIVIERPDGHRMTALSYASPIRNAGGEVVGAVNVLVDVSESEGAASERRLLAAIVDSSEDAIVSKSLDGVILSWNAGAERLFGHSAAEVLGKNIMLLIPTERQNEEAEILARIRRGERIAAFETVRLTKAGRRIEVSLSISPIRDEQGRIVGASKIARDMSARKRAEQAFAESEQRFRRFMQYLPGLAWIKDKDGRYVFINDSAERAFGHVRDDVYGRTDFDLFPPETAAQFRVNDERAVASGAVVEAIETLVQADGLHHSLVSKFPIPGTNGRSLMVGGVAIDVTQRINAEAALRESESRFRDMADHAPALIWVNSLAGCEFVNREYLRFLGLPLEEIQGRKWAEYVHPDDVDDYVAIYERAMADGVPFEAEFRFRRADGEYRWMHSSGVPRFAGDGVLVGYVGCSVDIDDAKRASESLRAVKEALSVQLADMRRLHEMSVRLSTTLELQPILDETLRTAAAIEGAEMALLSLYDPRRRMLEARASLGFSEESLALLKEVAPGLGACGASFSRERRVVVDDVETDPVFEPFRDAARQAGFRAVHSTPLITRRGNVVGVLTTHFRRPRRPTDREIHLIDLCARQAVDFIENARLYEELREADRRKDAFLATLAHELRNPLAPISNAFQFLRMEGQLSANATRVLDIMEQQTHHLVRLVDDLLEVSRITRNKIELRRETVDLASLVLSAVETSRPAVEAAGHQLAITLPPTPVSLFADPVRITQAIANLLNNAAKFTEPGGQIWLSAKRDNGDAIVTVRDSGIGIATEALSRVFDMFAQADRSLNRTKGGLGLGLTLAKSLVQMHGGDIMARSEGNGRGSEFTVRLPAIAEDNRADAATGAQAEESLPPRNVLIVDDSDAARYVLGKLLQRMGQQVRTTSDAAEAIKMALADRPDLIISDIAMPEMDGYEFARRLRDHAELSDITLVALTGYGQESDRQLAKSAGFDHHLTKPVSADALRELLRR